MAKNEQGGPQYSAQDMARILNDLLQGDEGLFANTVFSRPRDPYDYDSISATAAMTSRMNLDTYFRKIAQVPVLQREKALAAATGLGETLVSGVDTVMDFSPSLGMSLIQHHGGEKAVSTLLEMGNSIGSARNGTLGGVLNPRQLSENMKYAASQSALAYRNNFNKEDGTINIDQTHGLNLQTAALISGLTLSDRSQYTSWAERMHAKGPGLSQAESDMSFDEIESFKDGVGQTAAAEKSFNNQIKTFTEQINKFVASVSKFTGDCNSAIEFLQQATGGKLFSSGTDAAKSREAASRLAVNMRVAAADAGISPQALSVLAGDYAAIGSFADHASGFDARSITLNQSPVSTRLGALTSMGMARWIQGHRYATELNRQRATIGFEDTVSDYQTGDMVKMTPLAAQLVANGLLDKNEVKSMAASGNAEGMLKLLSRVYGGESRVREFMNDRKNLEEIRLRHSDLVTEFDSSALAGGLHQEKIVKGSRNMFDRLKTNLASEQITLRRNAIGSIAKELGMKSIAEELVSEDILKASGISDPAKIKELRQKQRDWNLTEEQLLDQYIGEYGGSADQAEKALVNKMTASAKSRFGEQSDQVRTLRTPADTYTLEETINKMHAAALVDEKNLEYAGVKDAGQRKRLQEEAKQKGWTVDRIREEVGKVGGDTMLLDRAASQQLVSDIEKYVGEDSAAVKEFKAGRDRIYGTRSDADLRRDAYTDILTKEKTREISDVKAKLQAAQDSSSRDMAWKELKGKVTQGLKGENGFIVSDRDYIENLFSQSLKPGLSASETNKAVEGAVRTYQGEINRGHSQQEALDKVRTSQFGTSFKEDFDSSENREKAFDKAVQLYTVGKVVRQFAKKAGITSLNDDSLKERAAEVDRRFTELRSKNARKPEGERVSDDFLLAEALKERMDDVIGTLGDGGKKAAADTLNQLRSRQEDIGKTVANAGYDYVSQVLKVDRSAIGRGIAETFGTLKGQPLNDPKAFDKAVQQRFNGKSRLQEANRYVIQNAPGENEGIIAGQSAGKNSEAAFYASMNEQKYRGDMQGAISAMTGNDYVARFIDNIDLRDAKMNGRMPATFSGDVLERLNHVLDVSGKMDFIDGNSETKEPGFKKTFVKSVTTLRDVDNNGNKDDNDLALAFKKINENYGKSETDEDFLKGIEKVFGQQGTKATEILQEYSAKSGMSVREIVTSVAAGAGKTGDTQRRAESIGYIGEHARRGAPELSGDHEMATYLSKLVGIVSKIAERQGIVIMQNK